MALHRHQGNDSGLTSRGVAAVICQLWWEHLLLPPPPASPEPPEPRPRPGLCSVGTCSPKPPHAHSGEAPNRTAQPPAQEGGDRARMSMGRWGGPAWCPRNSRLPRRRRELLPPGPALGSAGSRASVGSGIRCQRGDFAEPGPDSPESLAPSTVAIYNSALPRPEARETQEATW